MRNTLMTAMMILALTGSLARAASMNDEMFANAALLELHKLAIASSASEQAAKDRDRFGCRAADDKLRKAAHAALSNMHRMSFGATDAIERISSLLRNADLANNGCPYDAVIQMGTLSMMAGQAIVGLRTDYAIGDADWYTANTSGEIELKNPLRYAQSLNRLNYSWVSVRPQGYFNIGVTDTKTEMASSQIDDPAMENSGNNLKVIQVDYRKNSTDDYTSVFFYRTKEEAQASAARKERDKKAIETINASNADWALKFTSLPYMLANHNAGFKVVYAICKPIRNVQDDSVCREDDSHDWSDGRAVPYRWFSEFKDCADAGLNLTNFHPADVKVNPDETFVAYCVPAGNLTGRALKGFQMVFHLSPPDADIIENIYAYLRSPGSQSATVFQTFNACYDAMDATYSLAMKDLGANENGSILSDNAKTIGLTGTCVRVY